MTYAVPATTPSPGPPAPTRRPAAVTAASALLAAMGAAGLVYAVAMLAITPAVVDRFRRVAARTGSGAADADGFVTLLTAVSWVGLLLAVVLAAVLAAASVGLRRGRRGARTATYVVCGLGLAGGGGSAVAVAVQRGLGTDLPGEGLGPALTAAYPAGWVGLNIALALLQILGYALVALLLATGSGTWFDRWRPGAPTWGAGRPVCAPPAPAGWAPPGVATWPPPAWTPPGPAGPPPPAPHPFVGYPGIANGQPAPPAPSGPPPLPPDALDWARPADPPPTPEAPAAPEPSPDR
ncbi:hypothetical protein [Spirilliplanes yamanashiensis]|uniref:Uncharacterized protein n=1 Tax=Spirilliplanes yamanashiensis TaxID=42233 RepID=A0A8J3Y7D7_9ACTN|nr:hypothetical protein [Spirilliplanes yamanashiensis]MDP9815083.1 hypothetical protein [Spirilliplanes yamanashiensis]GIJ02739.1 hypothetical protein Sya03_20910 [Spirilliplanes yamanashiensis]